MMGFFKKAKNGFEFNVWTVDGRHIIPTDHFPVLISLSSDNSDNGRGLWKYGSSLVYDEFLFVT